MLRRASKFPLGKLRMGSKGVSLNPDLSTYLPKKENRSRKRANKNHSITERPRTLQTSVDLKLEKHPSPVEETEKKGEGKQED